MLAEFPRWKFFVFCLFFVICNSARTTETTVQPSDILEEASKWPPSTLLSPNPSIRPLDNKSNDYIVFVLKENPKLQSEYPDFVAITGVFLSESEEFVVLDFCYLDSKGNYVDMKYDSDSGTFVRSFDEDPDLVEFFTRVLRSLKYMRGKLV